MAKLVGLLLCRLGLHSKPGDVAHRIFWACGRLECQHIGKGGLHP